MKRIEFIAPVESMRGNLSGAQKLEYPTDNLGAYEGPMGMVNYARNYSPRFVGAKIAKSGRKYFAVRLRSANHLTTKSKKAMALLGGTGAIYAAILKVPSLLAGIQAQFAALTESGMQKSFRKYVTDVIRNGLIEHRDLFTFAGQASLVQVDNPWVKTAASLNIQISQAILVKFWSELASNPVTFEVNGQKGVAHNGDTFTEVSSTGYNVLGLGILSLMEGSAVYIGSQDDPQYLQTTGDTPAYVDGEDVVANGSIFTTTGVDPE